MPVYTDILMSLILYDKWFYPVGVAHQIYINAFRQICKADL